MFFKSNKSLQSHFNFGQCSSNSGEMASSHQLGGTTDQEYRGNVRTQFPKLETDDPSIADDADNSDSTSHGYPDDSICLFAELEDEHYLNSDPQDFP